MLKKCRSGCAVKTQMMEKICTIVQQVLNIEEELRPDEDLIGRGLDSVKTVHLIVLLEEMIDIRFDDSDLILENFRSIQNIINLLKRKEIRYD